jgi:hypothetical protein
VYRQEEIKKNAPCLHATVQTTARCACGWSAESPAQKVKDSGGGGDGSTRVTRQGRKHAALCGPGKMEIVTIQKRRY